jgi:ubiquinone/menaquinone biosynthesis C-methylase UbiE
MNDQWGAVWDRKGNSDSEDRLFLGGFDQLDFPVDFEAAAKTLTRILAIKPEDRVLEVGCAAGLIARHLDCRYIGVDKSEPMIKKNIAINKNSACACEADDLIFKDKTFDKSYVFTVFQYFPDLDYARRAMEELIRVTKKSLYIGDIPKESHDSSHCLYTEEFFAGWEPAPALYPRENRFSIVKHL